jgi:hypothetical protein
VSPTKGGDWLATVRTGSSAKASLVSVRSSDRGKTWSAPEKLPIAGKLPTLQLLPNGTLALLTAHSKNHCRLYLSADGMGREWSPAHILTSLCGGNAGMTVTGEDSLVVITPANRRIDAWRVKLHAPSVLAKDLAAPTGITFAKGVLSWSGSAASYRVTPVLIKPAASYTDTEVHPHAVIQTTATRLHLSRQLLIGGRYRFEIAAMDRECRVSAVARTAEVVVGP